MPLSCFICPILYHFFVILDLATLEYLARQWNEYDSKVDLINYIRKNGKNVLLCANCQRKGAITYLYSNIISSYNLPLLFGSTMQVRELATFLVDDFMQILQSNMLWIIVN